MGYRLDKIKEIWDMTSLEQKIEMLKKLREEILSAPVSMFDNCLGATLNIDKFKEVQKDVNDIDVELKRLYQFNRALSGPDEFEKYILEVMSNQSPALIIHYKPNEDMKPF